MTLAGSAESRTGGELDAELSPRDRPSRITAR